MWYSASPARQPYYRIFNLSFFSFFVLEEKLCTGYRARGRSRASRTYAGIGTSTGTASDRTTARGFHHQFRLGKVLDLWVRAALIQLLLRPPASLEQCRQLKHPSIRTWVVDCKFFLQGVRRANAVQLQPAWGTQF